MKKLSDKDQVRLYKLHESIKQGTYSGETVEIPVEIALTILKKMVHAEFLFDGAYYKANASYGSNHVEGKATSLKDDRDACRLSIEFLRKAIL